MKKVIFARNLTAMRKAMNITQENMAEKCGVSRQAVTKWECGSSLPDLYKLSDIAEILEVTVDQLLYGENSKKEDLSLDSQRISCIDKKMDMLLKKLEESYKRKDIYEEYNNYSSNDMENDAPGHVYFDIGCEEAGKGNMNKAIYLLEEALIRGETEALNTIMEIYKDIMEIYVYEEDEEAYYRYELELAQKIQKYGKIVEAEAKKRYRY